MSSDHGSIPVMFKPAGEDLHGTVLLRFVTECKRNASVLLIQGSVPPSLSPSLTAIFRILCFLIATQLTCPLSSPTVFAPLLQKVSFSPPDPALANGGKLPFTPKYLYLKVFGALRTILYRPALLQGGSKVCSGGLLLLI